MPPVIQNINIRPVNRQPTDIQDVKRAIQSAEATNPIFTLLYDLYDIILLDGHLTAVVKKFINAVTGAEWEFSKEGEVIPHVNDLIDTPEFESTLIGIAEAILWGITWMEFGNFSKEGFEYWKIPRKHIRRKTGVVAYEQNGEDGINVREGIYAKTVMEVGGYDDFGLLRVVAQYVIYKRGNFGDWAQFAEIFGMPFRIGEYDGYDDSQRAQLEKALDEAGSAAYAVIPKGANIRFEQNKSNGDGGLYKLLKDACNQEISVAILGQTETTTSSSSSGYAQSQTHAQTEDELFKGLRDFVRRVLNRKFVKILQANGVDTQGGYFIVKGEGQERLSLKDSYLIHKSMHNDLGMPVDHDSLYEMYGLSKPEDYETQLQAIRAAQEARNMAHTLPPYNTEEDDEADKGEDTQLNAKEKTLWEKVMSFFAHAPLS